MKGFRVKVSFAKVFDFINYDYHDIYGLRQPGMVSIFQYVYKQFTRSLSSKIES